ncbi:acyloxyacyl hydrolase [Aliihoeflea sp. PC F10.4]
MSRLAAVVPAIFLAATFTAHSQEFGRNSDRWEVRFGVGAFDAGPFTRQQLPGAVINGEVLAPAPDFLGAIGSPRPYIGFDAAIADDPIHVVYAGLNWEAYFAERFYVGFSVGGSLNSDERIVLDDGRVKDLGSPVLFHLQASIGYDFTEQVTAQVYLNHFSNAGLASANNGLESVGVRLGYRF